jgi:hypothetical protein
MTFVGTTTLEKIVQQTENFNLQSLKTSRKYKI